MVPKGLEAPCMAAATPLVNQCECERLLCSVLWYRYGARKVLYKCSPAQAFLGVNSQEAEVFHIVYTFPINDQWYPVLASNLVLSYCN